MHEFHAWVGLSESTEESDLGGLQSAVVELQELTAESQWHDAVFEVKNLNGQYFFTADGMVNRRREEGERLDLFLAIIAHKLPGSWGLVYDRDDEMPDPPGANAFRVRVLARGQVAERPDPFLSPCNPVIENLWRLARCHVHETAVVTLEGHGHSRGRAVPVLGDDQVRFARSG